MTAPPLSFWHPASLLATWFGSGLLPKMPGTWGSLSALPFAAGLVWLGGPWTLLAAAAAMFVVGLWASARYAAHLGLPDPGAVVVDEVVGQWLAIVPVALDPPSYATAFLFFRFFDIVKVWPANVLQRRLTGGWGIMADDVVAGAYAGAATFAVLHLMRP
ncbi:MAG: phosphatidylglycerophosphatase A [Kiloniellaceae bacterium]